MQWLIFFGMLAGSMIAVEGISRSLIYLTGGLFKKWKLKPNQPVLLVTTRSIAIGIVAEVAGTWFWIIGFSPATTIRVGVWLDVLAASAFVISAYRTIDLLCTHVIEQILRHRQNRGDIARTLAPFLSSTLKVVIVIVGLTIVLGMVGVNVVAIITGLSIGGVALALASQDTIKNLFGSMMLIADHPFDVGDLINVGGVDGTVE
jgi:MscS family membrane protein